MAVSGSNCREGPVWLPYFLKGKYFTSCKFHNAERNHFCIHCMAGPLCHVGLREHSDHKTLQIRRASHFDAVRVADVQKLVDITQIQTYVINSAKIVFLLPRPQQKIAKEVPNACKSCGRSLADPVCYCSIGCKLIGVKENLSNSDLSLTLSDEGPFSSPLRKVPAIPPANCCEGSRGEHAFRLIPAQKDFAKEIADGTSTKKRKREAGSDQKHMQHSMQRPVSPISAGGFDSPPAPSTPQSRESGSLRGEHKRKGTPHRAPFT